MGKNAFMLRHFQFLFIILSGIEQVKLRRMEILFSLYVSISYNYLSILRKFNSQCIHIANDEERIEELVKER